MALGNACQGSPAQFWDPLFFRLTKTHRHIEEVPHSHVWNLESIINASWNKQIEVEVGESSSRIFPQLSPAMAAGGMIPATLYNNPCSIRLFSRVQV